MGLASALSTALTGLNAAETTIDVVGNNVANSNTVAFKSSQAIFATQFLQTVSLGSGPTDNRGGTNPRQIGLGTKVAEIVPDFTQGTIQVSSSPSDLAIQGDGFFMVAGSQGERFFSRNGIFKTNSENQLVTVTGQRLLGFGVDDNFTVQNTTLVPLTIPLGATAVAQATQNVVLAGTLTPTGDVADTAEIIQSAQLSDGSREFPGDDVADTPVQLAVLNPPVFSTIPTVNAGAGSIPAGTYQYRITEVNTVTGIEGPPSATYGPVTLIGGAGSQAVDLGALPANSVGFNSYSVYRSNGGAFTRVASNQAPGAFTDTAAAGAGAIPDTLAQGNYGYYVTFFSSSQLVESRPTALVGPQSVSVDGRRVVLSNIDVPTDPAYDRIRIYRNTTTDTSTYYQLTELPAGTTTYADGAADSAISSNPQVNLEGPAIGAGTALVNVVKRDGSTYSNLFQPGVLSYTGNKGGRDLTAKELTITASTTVQDLLDFVEQASGIQTGILDPVTGLPIAAGGNVVGSRMQFTSNRGTGNALNIDLAAFKLTPTGSAQQSVNLDFNSTQTAVGESAVTDFIAYDSLGIPVNVRVTAVLESRTSAATTFRWFADSGSNQPGGASVEIAVGTGQIVFDGKGNVSSVSNSTVAVQRENVSSDKPLQFNLDFSTLSGLAAPKSTLAATRQDGSGPGVLSSFIIGEDGLVRGVFSNGITRDLGQIRLARFANNSGLEQKGENLFSTGVNSGLPIEGNPGDQGIGTIIAGATELSNTDIGQNLIDLITASTQYRGGTRVITAVQQLLDELRNLRR